MTNAILFDLDNTLILFDEVKFFKAYIHKVAPIMSDIVSPATLWQMVLKSTKAVLHNDGKLTNKDVFFRTFTKGLEDQTQEIWNRFLRFYNNEFDQLKSLVIVNKGITEIFSLLYQKKIKIVIASNPFWPRVAMEKRMEWAGLNKEKVDLVTHMENMHFCKPRLEYYQEICNKINEQPENCLIVGDDPINDMVAGKLKMKTFLATDNRKYKSQLNIISEKIRFGFRKASHQPDYQGPLIQLREILPNLI
ncbi:MAG: HAD family hydrolase [Candidatus Atribacteria bacterium]|nr:HAD family hydrolase [Candidatus Atribacteria bacterium]